MKESDLLRNAARVIEVYGWGARTEREGPCILDALACVHDGRECWSSVPVPDALLRAVGPQISLTGKSLGWLLNDQTTSAGELVFVYNDNFCANRDEAIATLLYAADLAQIDEVTGGVPRCGTIEVSHSLEAI